MTSREIRQRFLDFFKGKGHAIVPSASVVPPDDPTLMFTNAGMNQFKDVFLGTGSRPYKRVADTQKCIRAGGKHNDLDDVGQDTYHHTFFEMLGNWSFGDYFKKEAIEWAWELLTGVWGIEKDRLYATYFEGDESEGLEPDDEAARLWREMTDVEAAHVIPGNKKDNFWEMGEVGPCGPCSEIHIDLTPDKTGAPLVNAGDHRVIEIWNLVFIQFDRAADGKLTPLPARHVDTGMGFERLCAVLQGMDQGRLGQVSNYDTDVFAAIFAAIQKRTKAPDYQGTLPSEPRDSSRADVQPSEKTRAGEGPRGLKSAARDAGHEQVMLDVSYRVIADHLRCLTFALTDGAVPSNEGRGYVLRRILRRAVRYGRQYMDMHEPFLCDLVQPVVDHMADAFSELRTAHNGGNIRHVCEIVRDEEESFLRALDRGIPLFEHVAEPLRRLQENLRAEVLPIQQAQDRLRQQLAPGQQTQEAIRKQLEPIKNMQERLREHLAPFQQMQDEIRKQLEPIQKMQEHLRKQLAPFQQMQDEIRDQLEPIQKMQERLREQSAPFEQMREEIRRQLEVFKDTLRRLRLQVDGPSVFKLHDTYGFPIDLTQIMAEEKGLRVDIDGYELLMKEARERARQSLDDLDSLSEVLQIPKEHLAHTTDDSPKYEATTTQATYLFATGLRDKGIDAWTVRGLMGLVFDKTCFYAEQGGQVGDTGTIVFGTGQSLAVSDTKHAGNQVIHLVDPLPLQWQGPVRCEQRAVLRVDRSRREHIMQNHTSTHMLNWALREVLGEGVQQKGSLVDPDKTRFDFSHNKPVTPEELERVEALVNQQIEARHPVFTQEVDQAKALRIKTLRAVFGEKYPDRVRVVSIGAPIGDEENPAPDALLGSPDDPKWMRHPVEFCGGTHLKNTGEAERFVLISEEGVAKGIRRVVGVSGEAARKAIAKGAELLHEADRVLEDRSLTVAARKGADLTAEVAALQRTINDAVIPIVVRHKLGDKLAELRRIAKEQAKRQSAASGRSAMEQVAAMLESAETVNGVTIVVGQIDDAPAEALRGAIDWVRNKTPASAVLLASTFGAKVILVAGMSDDVVDRGIKAGELVREIAPIVGGSGGGKPTLAQAGGKDPEAVPQALEKARTLLRERFK